MKTILLTAVLLGLSALPAVAQSLPPKPISNYALLKAQAKRQTPVMLVPAVALEVAETAPVYNTAAARVFATKIHPILMNACAGCHARADYAGTFKLKRIAEGYENAAGVERNLAAVVKQLDRTDPSASPLLGYAVLPHGKSKEAPLHSTRHPAYPSLELWTYWATMPEGSAVPTVLPVRAAKKAEPTPTPVATSTPMTRIETKLVTPVQPVDFNTLPKPMEPTRVNPDDPFDPGSFNRKAHPNRR